MFGATGSITGCPFTSDPDNAPLIRIPVPATPENGLRAESRLMVDKVMTPRRSKLSDKIGHLEREHMLALERALLVFFGLA